VDAAQRFEFFEFVRDQWGTERAGQLMDLLPPAGATDLVTSDQLRRELAELRVEMHDGFARIADRVADQTRVIVLAVVGLWLSGLGLSVAVTQLLG
jgi:hypothetical protein